MALLGLTGGIGSGKSSVSSRLAERGAIIVDADAIVHELQEPGQAVFLAMVERWGDKIVADDGALDRQAVAGIVFSDKDELKAIEAIVHPAVRTEIERRITEASPEDVVILDNPLLVESVRKAKERIEANKAATSDQDGDTHDGDPGSASAGSTPLPEAIIVIDCPPDVAIGRLIEHRGFTREDAEARIRAQVAREDRLEVADFVVANGGSLADLDAQIEPLWAWIQTQMPS